MADETGWDDWDNIPETPKEEPKAPPTVIEPKKEKAPEPAPTPAPEPAVEEKAPETKTRLAQRPPMGDNVKILLYGGAGTGKTRAALMKFKQLWEQEKAARCKFFDTDKGLTEVLKEADEKGNRVFPPELVDNIDWYNCKDFDAILDAMKEVFTETTKHDVIVFDMIDKLYEDAQEKYTQDIFGDDLVKYTLHRRKTLNEGTKRDQGRGVFEGWTDWVAIKLLHNRGVIDKITKEIGCHVICLTSAKAVDMNDPDKGQFVKNPTIFTRIGFAPSGEKRNDHRFDRIYYFSMGADTWYYMAVKKRGGEIYKKIPVKKGDYPDL